MKLIALGTGSAFSKENFHTNFLLETNEKKLLIDCGSDCRHSLNKAGYTYKDIDAVFISHLHGDHCGGLEWLGFSKYFDPTQKRPRLHISESLLQPLWNNVLSGGMGSLERKITTIDDYFEIFSFEKNELFYIDDIIITPVQTIHVMNGYYIVPSFGLLIKDKEKTIFITGDTQFAPEQIKKFYEMSDIIIHDCECLYLPDKTPIFSTVHSHYEKLRTLPISIRKKMWLVHYQDSGLVFPGLKYIDDEFIGFASPSQCFYDSKWFL